MSKYTINDVIQYIGKEEIENLCQNMYYKMLPRISKVACPLLHIDWNGTDDDCGSYTVPILVTINIRNCISAMLDDLIKLEDSPDIIGVSILYVIVHELSHAVQDVDVMELYNEKYNNDKPYRTLVERDADSRTLSILEQNDEFIKEEFGIDVMEWYGIECNEFFEITNDIDEIRFISLTIDYFLAHKHESNEDMRQSRIISRFIRDALSSSDCYMIDLTLNDTTIILKQIAENITDELDGENKFSFVTPKVLTDWIINNLPYDITASDCQKSICIDISWEEDRSVCDEMYIKLTVTGI